MKSITQFKNMFIFLIVLVAIAGGYIYFFRGGDVFQIKTGGEHAAATSEARAAQQQLISLLRDLRAIKLDLSVFEDPRFRSLTDFTPVIEPEPVGRENPFAPTTVSIPVSQDKGGIKNP
jgi:hypothetical protein